jgi:transposase, IS5 family
VSANSGLVQLAAVNAQLQAHGMMVAQATGAVIDATLVSAAARPRSQRVIDCGDSAEEDANNDTLSAAEPTVTETLSVDPDATWLKKGKTSHFGFRTYATVDSDDGFARGVHTAPANQSETAHFEAAVKSADFTPCRTYADKGFASAANRKHLRGQGTKSAIMHKAQRNRPLSQRQRNANKAISKTRYTVEQCFGTMKRLFGMARASYLGRKGRRPVHTQSDVLQLTQSRQQNLFDGRVRGSSPSVVTATPKTPRKHQEISAKSHQNCDSTQKKPKLTDQ